MSSVRVAVRYFAASAASIWRKVDAGASPSILSSPASQNSPAPPMSSPRKVVCIGGWRWKC